MFKRVAKLFKKMFCGSSHQLQEVSSNSLNESLLPLVSKETMWAFKTSLEHNKNFFEDSVNRVSDENMEIVAFLKRFSDNVPKDNKKLVVEIGLLVYEILRSQAEADRLARLME